MRSVCGSPRTVARPLDAAGSPTAPAALRDLPKIKTLQQVWVQQFHLADGVLRRRETKHRPPGAQLLVTPYDTEAHGSVKCETVWDGYKVHFIETCGIQTPNMITRVVTTDATTTDVEMLPAVHRALAGHDLLPDQHFVDSGYIGGKLIVDAHGRHGVHLVWPTHAGTGWQHRAENGFGIDWDLQNVTCRGGKISARWARELRREKTVRPRPASNAN